MDPEAVGDPIFRLVYRSRSLIAPQERRTELGAIFTSSRRRNKRLEVTGALIISGDAFVQALEGEETAVRALYARIAEDDRHTDVAVVDEHPGVARTFGRWAMARVAEDGGADIRLASNASRSVIVEFQRPDTTITEDQEAVLASMRGAIALDRA